MTCFQNVFEPVVQPQPRPIEQKPENVRVSYGGRDVLNLMGNLTDNRWNYRATLLPPNNPALFFANRSQYHRLGPYGTRTEYVKDSCRHCGFNWVVAATDWWDYSNKVMLNGLDWDTSSAYPLSLCHLMVPVTITDWWFYFNIYINLLTCHFNVAEILLLSAHFLFVLSIFIAVMNFILLESW